MRQQRHINEDNDGSMPIATLLGILLVLALCACKPTKEIQVERVEVPVVVTQEHTVESVKIDHVRDTLIHRDSVFYWVNGDTVRIEKWHYLQGTTNIVKVDTLHVFDSVPYPVEVMKEHTTVKTEKVNVVHWWQKGLMWIGGLFLTAVGVLAFFTIRRIRK